MLRTTFAALCVRKIYVAKAVERQWRRAVPRFGGNITFAYESERYRELDEQRIGNATVASLHHFANRRAQVQQLLVPVGANL